MSDTKLLFFVDGYLKYVYDRTTSMTHSLDSAEMKRYNAQKSYCTDSLKKSLSLDDDEELWWFETESYDIIDEIQWNDSTFVLNTSPIAYFDSHKDLFNPDSERPLLLKIYEPKWAIADGRLYLYDISFIEETYSYSDEESENKRKEYLNRVKPVRFQEIEKMTERTFRQVPSLNNREALFADWFSGRLYFKRFPKEDDVDISAFRRHRYRFRTKSSYECEPFYVIIVEKGEIKSMEKTSYMIVKREPEYE